MVSVRQLLNRKGSEVLSISPKATVREAITLMATRNIGALPVMEDDVLLGIITERDYARNVILKGRSSKDTCVDEVMSTGLTTVRPDQSVTDCMELMTEKRIRHLPVVEEGRVVGIISIGDVVMAVISNQASMIEHLEGYISPR
jgi:CBS domain-containing protein